MSGRRKRKGKAKNKLGKSPPQPAKIKTWTLPTVLSLAIGILGLVALVELRTQIRVEPQSELLKSEPFSIPFQIANDGYLSFRIRRIFCYAHELKAGNLDAARNTVRIRSEDGQVIESGGATTVMCNIERGYGLPTTADIAVVVDYEPWMLPFTSRHYDRFIGVHGDNWQWTKQPSGAIEKEAELDIERNLRQIHD